MRIDVTEECESLEDLHMIHRGEELIWDAGSYDRLARGEVKGIFRDLNAYWASLPIEEQDAIFAVYKEIHATFEEVFGVKQLHSRLTTQVRQLLDLHPMEKIQFWITAKSDLRIPASMKEAYAENDAKERTYLRADYAGLMVLALSLRPLVPVWGVYIQRIKGEFGNNYREYVAMGLLGRSQQIRSQQMLRLRTYVEAWIGQDNVTLSSMMGGLGSSELPDWLLAQVLVRRLALVDIGGSDESNNLISNAYREIRGSIEQLGRKFSGRIGDKGRDDEDRRDDNVSFIEHYKIKQVISDGDLITLASYAQQMEDIIQRVDPSASLEILAACHEALSAGEVKISAHHIALAQWVLRSALPPRSIPSINRLALLRVLAVTQTLLWHWGFLELAALAGGSPYTAGRETVGQYKGPARISRDAVERLSELYPHYQDNKGTQARERQLNVACKAINALVDNAIARHDWQIAAPEELLRLIKIPLHSRRLVVSADIRNQLASLIIMLAEREKVGKINQEQESQGGAV